MPCDFIRNVRKKWHEYDENANGWIQDQVGMASRNGASCAEYWKFGFNPPFPENWPVWFYFGQVIKKYKDPLDGEEFYRWLSDDGRGKMELRIQSTNYPEEVAPGRRATQIASLVVEQKDDLGLFIFRVVGGDAELFRTTGAAWEFSDWDVQIGEPETTNVTAALVPLRRCHDCTDDVIP